MAKQTAKYGNWTPGNPEDDDARMIHYCKRQIGKFLNRFPEPTRMDVAQHVTRFLQANLPPIMVAKMSDVMRAAETAETVERRKFYVLRLLQMMSSGRPHQVVQRLKQPYAPRPAEEKSAKAAAVVAAAKAVGTPRVKAPMLDPKMIRSQVARYATEIRASLDRGYVNLQTVAALKQLMDRWAMNNPGSRTAEQAARWALQLNFLVVKQPGQQMRDMSPEVAENARAFLKLLVTQLQSGY